MASLFEYNKKIDELIAQATDEDGVIDESMFEKLDALELERNEKIDNCIAYLKSRRAIADALNDEKKAIERRQKTALNEMNRMKDYLAYCLRGEKYESTAGKISYRKSESVEVTNAGLLPSEFLRYKDPEPDKAGLKKVLKTGATIAGAHLVETVSTIIK